LSKSCCQLISISKRSLFDTRRIPGWLRDHQAQYPHLYIGWGRGRNSGKENAEATVKGFEEGQSSEDRWTGWRYFLEKTEIKPGTDPQQATSLRQNELETRESKALDQPPSVPSELRPIRN
jgi:hypothetical protein